MTDTEKIELLQQIFKGRNDVYGAGECVKEAITDDVIKAHLTGKKRIGRYPLSPHLLDGSGILWSVADIDDDDLGLAVQFSEALEHIEIPCYIERSKSKGYHDWVFFTEPIEAKWARGLMKYAIDLLERDTNYRIKEPSTMGRSFLGTKSIGASSGSFRLPCASISLRSSVASINSVSLPCEWKNSKCSIKVGENFRR